MLGESGECRYPSAATPVDYIGTRAYMRMPQHNVRVRRAPAIPQTLLLGTAIKPTLSLACEPTLGTLSKTKIDLQRIATVLEQSIRIAETGEPSKSGAISYESKHIR